MGLVGIHHHPWLPSWGHGKQAVIGLWDSEESWDAGLFPTGRQCLDHKVLACRSCGMRDAVPAQCPWLPFAGMEDEQCPDHQLLLCSLPASPTQGATQREN